jgi:hypothetical protein
MIPDAVHARPRSAMNPARLVGEATDSTACSTWSREGRVDRQELDDRVGDGVAEVAVAQDDAGDPDQHDRERREREQHPVGDPGGVLRTAVVEERADGGVQLARDAHDQPGAVLRGGALR